MLTHGVMMGVGASILYVTSASCVSHWFEKKRALATGIAVSGAGFGNVIFPPVVEAAFHAYGWRVALRFMAMISFVSVTGYDHRKIMTNLLISSCFPAAFFFCWSIGFPLSRERLARV